MHLSNSRRFMRNIFLFFSIIIIFIYSCQQDTFNTDKSASLRFSTDTVKFDTVFSTIGTATYEFKIYNPYKQNLNISEIYLAGGRQSNYRININGIQTYKLTNVEMRGKDSMYIFVELTVDPTNQDSPVIVQDSVVFVFNNHSQHVDLLAYGQDVHILRDSIIPSQTWTSEKPYIIYDRVFLSENQTLSIEAGTKIFFHRKAKMFILGTLNINGMLYQPVVMQADRLEDMYNDVPGQWDGIVIASGNNTHSINYTEIRNAVLGIQFGNAGNLPKPRLEISNTKIENMTVGGILTANADIFATNCLIANCGEYGFKTQVGGTYQFYDCTFANYWGQYANTSRVTPTIEFNNKYEINNEIFSDNLSAYFGNCLIFGNMQNEVETNELNNSFLFTYKFENCVLRLDFPTASGLDTSNHNYFTDCIYGKYNDTIFVSPYESNYELDTISSLARDKASVEVINRFLDLLGTDIKGVDRFTDGKPDIGVFEFVKKP